MTGPARVFRFVAPLALALLGVASTARAAGEPVTAAPPVAEPAPIDRATDTVEAKPHKWISFELNPLAATIGRYSAQVEYLPALHHALVFNPHFDSVGADVTSGSSRYRETFSGFGGELGYRFYTGQKGPNGFFVGPSLLLGTYSASSNAGGSSASTSFTSIGGAIDIGGQAVIGPGIVVGGGFGLQYTSVSKDFADLPLTAGVLAGGGVRPRFLLSVGYAL